MSSAFNPQYISLIVAAELTGYSQEYLSLRARQKKLKAVKLGRNWVTTKDWAGDYLEQVKLVNGAQLGTNQIQAKKTKRFVRPVIGNAIVDIDVDDAKRYVSLHEASQYANHSADYLNLRARQGKFKAIKLGRNWVTTKEWVNEYLFNTYKNKNHVSDVSVEPVEYIPEIIFVAQPTLAEKEYKVAEQSVFSLFKHSLSWLQTASAFAAMLLVLGVSAFYVFKPQININSLTNVVINFSKDNYQKLSNNVFEISSNAKGSYQAVANSISESGKNIGGNFQDLTIDIDRVKINVKLISKRFSDVVLQELSKSLAIVNANKNFFNHNVEDLVSNVRSIQNSDAILVVANMADSVREIPVKLQAYFREDLRNTKQFVFGQYQKIKFSLRGLFKGVYVINVSKGINEGINVVKKPFVELGVFLDNDVAHPLAQFVKSFGSAGKTMQNIARELFNGSQRVSVSLGDRIGRGVSIAFRFFGDNTAKLAKNVLDVWDYFANNVRAIPNKLAGVFQKKENLAVKTGEEIVFKPVPLAEQKGLVVIPSQGEDKDEQIKEKIKQSFSDEVKVQQKDAESGIIIPVFRDKEGDNYLYLMVPMPTGSKK